MGHVDFRDGLRPLGVAEFVNHRDELLVDVIGNGGIPVAGEFGGDHAAQENGHDAGRHPFRVEKAGGTMGALSHLAGRYLLRPGSVSRTLT